MRVVYPGQIGIWSVSFCGGRKTGENPWSKNENQQQTQPTYDTGPELNPGHIGGRRALSPVRQPCSPETRRVKLNLRIDLTNVLFIGFVKFETMQLFGLTKTNFFVWLSLARLPTA